MIKRKPPILKTADSGRVAEEKHNVEVTGFLYAAKREADNDFHCIVGMAPGDPQRFLNIEVSGLPPPGPARDQIKSARDRFTKFFGTHVPGAGEYSKFHPPIKVRVTGSSFFNIDLKAGVIGPTGFRPKSAWEIHPVTDIEFEP